MRRILVIGMVDSVHFSKWLESTKGMQYQFVICPSGPNRKIAPTIQKLLEQKSSSYELNWIFPKISLVVWILDKLCMSFFRSLMIRYLLKTKNIDAIHFHEMQSGGYPLLRIPSKVLQGFPIFYTPYGSDIYWFERFPKHRKRIQDLLKLVSGIFPECERDLVLAKNNGYGGSFFEKMPAAGTYNLGEIQGQEFSKRRNIVVKGYGGKWGRANLVLDQLANMEDELKDYEIHITSATKDVVETARRYSASTHLDFVVHTKFSLSQEEMLKLLSRSKAHIALSVSDGFPASLFEAAYCGAIPIQSDSACVSDDLKKIARRNFPAEEQWGYVGDVLIDLLRNDQQSRKLSESFRSWAMTNQHTKSSFQVSLIDAYESQLK